MTKMSKAIAVLGVVAGLGVAALPLSTYADTQIVPVEVEVSGAISITSDTATAQMSVKNNQDVAASDPVKLTVSTNNENGYTVTIKDSDNSTNLVTETNDVIPAGTPAQGTSAWGYKFGDATAYTGVTLNDVEVKTTSTASATNGDEYNLVFGVTTGANQAQGTYKGGVMLTAVVND